jgi:hypothetical protein
MFKKSTNFLHPTGNLASLQLAPAAPPNQSPMLADNKEDNSYVPKFIKPFPKKKKSKRNIENL